MKVVVQGEEFEVTGSVGKDGLYRPPAYIKECKHCNLGDARFPSCSAKCPIGIARDEKAKEERDRRFRRAKNMEEFVMSEKRRRRRLR